MKKEKKKKIAVFDYIFLPLFTEQDDVEVHYHRFIQLEQALIVLLKLTTHAGGVYSWPLASVGKSEQ